MRLYILYSDSVKLICFIQVFIVSLTQFLPNTSWVFYIYLEKESNIQKPSKEPGPEGKGKPILQDSVSFAF